eukprot:scaffold6435_cov30-Prasinocladus_malaysianus.AAC.1
MAKSPPTAYAFGQATKHGRRTFKLTNARQNELHHWLWPVLARLRLIYAIIFADSKCSGGRLILRKLYATQFDSTIHMCSRDGSNQLGLSFKLIWNAFRGGLILSISLLFTSSEHCQENSQQFVAL